MVKAAHKFVVKMTKIQSGVSLLLYSVVIVLCINLNNGNIEANQNSWNFIDISEIKNDIFNYETNTEYTHQYSEPDAPQCLLELFAIKDAVNKTELWALKSNFYKTIFSKTSIVLFHLYSNHVFSVGCMG